MWGLLSAKIKKNVRLLSGHQYNLADIFIDKPVSPPTMSKVPAYIS